MNGIVINSIFSIFTIYIFIRIISYGLYEIKVDQNKAGGIAFIVFSAICILFGNIMFWIN